MKLVRLVIFWFCNTQKNFWSDEYNLVKTNYNDTTKDISYFWSEYDDENKFGFHILTKISTVHLY